MNADTSKRQIRKTRYCLTYESQYFEIDVYPFWKDKAIVEIELNDEKAVIAFPNFIKIIKEVTSEFASLTESAHICIASSAVFAFAVTSFHLSSFPCVFMDWSLKYFFQSSLL